MTINNKTASERAYEQHKEYMQRKRYVVPRYEHTRAYGIEPGSDTYKDIIDEDDEDDTN